MIFFPPLLTPAVVQFPLQRSCSCTPVSFRRVALFSSPPLLFILLSSPHLGSISRAADTHDSDSRSAAWRRAKCANGKFCSLPKTARTKTRPQHYCHLAQLGAWTGGETSRRTREWKLSGETKIQGFSKHTVQ